MLLIAAELFASLIAWLICGLNVHCPLFFSNSYSSVVLSVLVFICLMFLLSSYKSIHFLPVDYMRSLLLILLTSFTFLATGERSRSGLFLFLKFGLLNSLNPLMAGLKVQSRNSSWSTIYLAASDHLGFFAGWISQSIEESFVWL